MLEFIEVLKNNPNHAYDWLASNYYKMSKEELKDIAKELIFSVYDNLDKVDEAKVLKSVGDELEEQYEE